MTPAARVRSAIELLDAIIGAACNSGAPADRILAEWFRASRFAGSKDRRAIRELVYSAIRACGPVPASGRAAMLRLVELNPELASAFDGSKYGPAALSQDEQAALGGLAPGWIEERLAASGIEGEEAASLLDRAPLDLRVNALKADRTSLDLPETGQPLSLPQAIRMSAGTQVEQWQAFRDGLVEVQDLGSQLACEAVGAQPGDTVVDLCAGAGGKTLALATAMGNEGTLIAADTDRARLARLAPRARRAGAVIADTVLLDPGREREALEPWTGRADRLLVDAPCSGTGTWRRNPESRWRLSEAELGRLVALQSRLLDLAAGLVRPGGSLTYVTCSLLDEEGAGQAAAFLDRHPGWAPDPPGLPAGQARGAGLRLSPYRDSTDGFFIARLSKPC